MRLTYQTLHCSDKNKGTPIVYVNLNYRLGALGFPQGSEAVSRNALNLGLKDQLLAFEWVQRNIHLFGGDRTKVLFTFHI